jgi:hypothetical protein
MHKIDGHNLPPSSVIAEPMVSVFFSNHKNSIFTSEINRRKALPQAIRTLIECKDMVGQPDVMDQAGEAYAGCKDDFEATGLPQGRAFIQRGERYCKIIVKPFRTP